MYCYGDLGNYGQNKDFYWFCYPTPKCLQEAVGTNKSYKYTLPITEFHPQNLRPGNSCQGHNFQLL